VQRNAQRFDTLTDELRAHDGIRPDRLHERSDRHHPRGGLDQGDQQLECQLTQANLAPVTADPPTSYIDEQIIDAVTLGLNIHQPLYDV